MSTHALVVRLSVLALCLGACAKQPERELAVVGKLK